MNYQQFVATIKEKVALSLDDGMDLQIHTTLKNNGRERVGITISDRRVNVSPTIYLEEYFHQFQNGDSIDDIAQSVLEIYHEVKFEHSWQIHTVKEFDIIKKKIVYKLINAQENQYLLQSLPHTLYMDLAIVYYVLFDVDASGTATIQITDELMDAWGTNLEEIHQAAAENTAKLLPYSFKPMRVVVDELLGEKCEYNILDTDLMYVLTNSLRSFGAGCMLYDNIFEKIGNLLNDNFYILPSSIHEVIIVPEKNSPNREDLDDMVLEINETQVDVEDMLSNHAYYYDYTKHCLC